MPTLTKKQRQDEVAERRFVFEMARRAMFKRRGLGLTKTEQRVKARREAEVTSSTVTTVTTVTTTTVVTYGQPPPLKREPHPGIRTIIQMPAGQRLVVEFDGTITHY